MLLTLTKPGRICNMEVIEFEVGSNNVTIVMDHERLTSSKYAMLLGFAVPETAQFTTIKGISTITFAIDSPLSIKLTS